MNEVKAHESFVPTLEEEAIEVEHLLAEPKNDHVSVDGVFCFDKESLEKCLEIEDNPCRVECGPKTNSGGLDSNTTQEGHDDLKLGGFNRVLTEVDEVGNLHAANGLSTACEDYLLDVEFAERVSDLDNAPRVPSTENSSSESHSPGFSGSDNTAVGISESSTASIRVPKSQNDPLDTTMIISSLGPTSGRASCTSTDGQYNKVSLVSQGVKRESLARWGRSTKSSVEASKIGTLTQKRLRKPTRRYIEELSDLRSRYLKGKQKSSTTSSKDKHLGVKSHNKHHHMGFRQLKLVPREEPFVGASSRIPRGYSKKRASIPRLDSDEEPYPDESEDDSVATTRSERGGDRRKNQRLWTLAEVIKLVDGVSHYGVGRWTDIKRLLFSSSAYRTPVDLRDKWRNLLRASCAQFQSDGEDEQKRKHASRPLPVSVLHRVSELATIYPYPKERNSNLSHGGHVTSSIPTTSKGTPFSLGRRAIPR